MKKELNRMSQANSSNSSIGPSKEVAKEIIEKAPSKNRKSLFIKKKKNAKPK